MTIETIPPGASVYVDSKDSGIAGQSGPGAKVPMTKGMHTVIIELDGYKPLEQKIKVGRAQKLQFKLQAQSPRLLIKTLATNPNGNGGEIFVDGTLSGTVPSDVEVTAGKHTVEVRRAGFEPFTEQVEIKPGESRAMLIAMFPVPAAKVEVPPPLPPPPVPVIETAPITLSSRNQRLHYTITVGAQQSCVTPCAMQIVPGTHSFSVGGPGSKIFHREVNIPRSPTQLMFQHFTLSRAIAGPILFLLGLGFGGSGAYFFAKEPIQNRPADYTVGSFLAIHGVVFFIVGVVQLATIKPNSISIIGAGRVASLNLSKPRLLGGGVAPTADRTGAVAGLTFSY